MKLPEELPPLPAGYVYLGQGKTFDKSKAFEGVAYRNNTWQKDSHYTGDVEYWHYAAPADSEIVKLNTPALMEEKTTPGSKVRVIGILKEVSIPLQSGAISTLFDLAVESNNLIGADRSHEELFTVY